MCSMHSQGGANSTAASPDRIGPVKLAVAGLAGGLATWAVVATWHPFYFSGLSFAPGVAPSQEQLAILNRQTWINTLSVFALFGASLSAALGIAAALHRRSMRTAAIGVPLGAVWGGAAGALGGWCGQRLSDPSFVELVDRSRPEAELATALIVHATCWGVIGLAVGLGFALAARSGRDWLHASLGAALGGILAAPCYQVVVLLVCLISPMGGTDTLIPEGNESRLFWFATAAVAIAVGAGGLSRRKEKPVAPASAPQPANPS
ncbi:MAG TPA: hypothetical protein VG826_02055 [Pirellulales bacterium]|nr:hypothetical protein [Pirellulales bacterium]